LKRLGLGFLALLLLLAIFHRPLFFEGTRYFIVRAARQQHLDLDYKMTGSIFTTLSVVDLRAKPTEPGPVQRLEIGTLNLRYSLWNLIRDGLPAFLKELDVRNVYVELTPAEPLPEEKQQKPQAFKFPALFPELLNLENVNVTIHGHDGDTVIGGLFFSLLPDRPGALRIGVLDIPGVRRWTDIKAATTYRDRHLVLSSLFVGPEIALREFHLNLSDLEKNELGVALDGTFFQAPVKLDAHVTDLNAKNHLTAELHASHLVFQSVWDYLTLPNPLQGELENLAVKFEGEPLRPASWNGAVQARLKDLDLDGRRLGAVALDATLANARADLALNNQLDEHNTAVLQATATLPEKFEDFIRTKSSGRIDLAANDTALQPAAGEVAARVDFQAADGLLNATATVDAKTFASAGAEVKDAHVTLTAERDLTLPADAPPFHATTLKLEAAIAEARYLDYTADALHLKLTTHDARVTLEELTLARQTNTLRAHAGYVLPDDLKSWDRQPLKFDLALNAPNLSAFIAPDSGTELKGTLTLAGHAEAQNGVLNGNFDLAGRDIEANKIPVRTVNAKVAVASNRVTVSQLDLVMNDQNRIQGDGEVQLGQAMTYWGGLTVALDDLSIFQPLVDQPLAGKLAASWKGSGDGARHSGEAGVDLSGGRFGDQKNLSAHFHASYTPDSIAIPDFAATSDLADATLALAWQNNRLSVTNLALRQQRLTLAEGSADIPLVLTGKKLEEIIPPREPLNVTLKTRDLNLRTLFRQLGQEKPPLFGVVNLDLEAHGTLDDLESKTTLRATGLQSPDANNFAPADLALDLVAHQDRLTVDGTLRQPLIQPLRITGNLPFDAAVVQHAGELDPATPVELNVSLPQSSLAFVSSIVPAIRQSRGTAAVDLRVRGTIGQPDLAGGVNASLEALRFTDPSLPPVSATTVRMGFAQNRLTIERCAGTIAGGSFQLAGGAVFTRLDNPTFNLRLGSKNVLVLQNDDMTARVSTDVRVTGPLSGGLVQGTVWVTRSRFFRNIDILPIGLPGRPAPQPPPEPTLVSFPQPPLRDWKFDVTVKTADPFLVQSNLANGRILIDLHLGGTGLEPLLEGAINIEHLTASLPFSRLQVDSSQVFFTRESPFVPQLNIRGTSNIRDYSVSVFITGPATDPNALFTSDPPLPQAEVVALLATGMTTQELGRDPNALAGRAAILLFQKLWHSAFRRNQPPPENESFLSRVQFDIGTIDPKTGRQSTSLGIPLSDNIILTGGLDVGGNFRGQVKYLIRFQ